MSDQVTVDAVIPVLNGFPELRACIDGLLMQSVQIRRIIILDSGSTDGTLEYLQGIDRAMVIPVPPGTFNHGLTRNLGWQHSDADFLFYTVQDARAVHTEALADLLRPFQDSEITGVCGRQIVCHDPGHNPVEWFRPVSAPRLVRHQLTDAKAFDALSPEQKRDLCGWDNVAAMYRRSAMEALPFRDRVFGEDLAWCVDALRSGTAIAYQPSATFCHYHLENPAFTLRRALSSMFVRYRALAFIHPAPVRSWKMLLRVIRLCFFQNDLSISRKFYWLRYNLQRSRSLRQAHALFHQALRSGDAGLDELYRAYIEHPHRPLKNG
jgi:rhamnosyltransferase